MSTPQPSRQLPPRSPAGWLPASSAQLDASNFRLVVASPKQLHAAGFVPATSNVSPGVPVQQLPKATSRTTQPQYATPEMQEMGKFLQHLHGSSSNIGAALSGATPQPKQPKEAKQPRAVVQQQQWIPTPQVTLTGEPSASTGATTVVDHAFLAVPGQGQMPQYMYSLDQAGELMTRLNEQKVEAEAKQKEIQRELRLAQRQVARLESELDEAYGREDELEAELQRYRQTDRASNRRPDVFLSISGPQLSFSSLPFVNTFDQCAAFHFMRSIPYFDSFPESVLWAMLRQAKPLVIPQGGSLLAHARVKKSLCVVLAGYGRHKSDDGEVDDLLGAGRWFGEHHLMGASASPGRDLVDWEVVEPLHCIAIPARIFRRVVLSECILLNRWTEALVASLFSSAYNPLRPPPRYLLRADPAHTSLLRYGTKYRALLMLTRGVHVTPETAPQPDESQGGNENGQSRRTVISRVKIPLHVRRNSPLHLMLLTAVSDDVCSAEIIRRMLSATADFWQPFVCSLYEVDWSANSLIVRIAGHKSQVEGSKHQLVGAVAECASRGEVLVINDCLSSQLYLPTLDAPICGERVKSLMCAPVWYYESQRVDPKEESSILGMDTSDGVHDAVTAPTQRLCGVLTLSLHAQSDAAYNSNQSAEPVFANREEELLQLMARRISDTLSESIRQMAQLTKAYDSDQTEPRSLISPFQISQLHDGTLRWRPCSLFVSDTQFVASLVPQVPPTALVNAAASDIEGDATFAAVPAKTDSSRAPWVYARGVVCCGATTLAADVISPSARAAVGSSSGSLSSTSNEQYAHRNGLMTGQRSLSVHWARPSSGQLQWCDTSVAAHSFPRAARLALTLYDEATHEPLGWAAMPLFTEQGIVCSGRFQLPVYAGAWPSPEVVAAAGVATKAIGTVEIELAPTDKPAITLVHCDALSRDWWLSCRPACPSRPVTAAKPTAHAANAAGLTVRGEGLFDVSSVYPAGAQGGRPLLVQRFAHGSNSLDVWVPARLTRREQQFLWHNRHLFANRVHALPVLMKAGASLHVGTSTAPQVDQLRKFVRSCEELSRRGLSSLPPATALQFLGAIFGEPELRAQAVESLQCLPLPELLPLLPCLCVALAHEQQLDCALGRFLLRVALHHAATARVQLFWSLRVLLHCQQLQVRAMAMLRVLLDACEESFTASMALQSFAMNQIALASQAVVGAERSRRTAALQKALGDVVLPFATRLPIQATPAIAPSVYYNEAFRLLAFPTANATEGNEDDAASRSSPKGDDILGFSSMDPSQFPFRAQPADNTAEGADEAQAQKRSESVLQALTEALAPLSAYPTDAEELTSLEEADLYTDGVVQEHLQQHSQATQHQAQLLPPPSPFFTPAATVALPQGGVPVRSIVHSKCRAVYSNSRRRLARSFVVFAAGSLDDLDLGAESGHVLTGHADRADEAHADSDVDDVDAIAGYSGPEFNEPLQVSFLDDEVSIVISSGPDALLIEESIHAAAINQMAHIWRQSGLVVGDFTATYAHGLHSFQSRTAAQSASVAAWTGEYSSTGLGLSPFFSNGECLGAVGGEGVPASLCGLLLVHPESQTLAEIFGIGEDDLTGATAAPAQDAAAAESGAHAPKRRTGYGKNCLQRWFMSQLFNRFVASSASVHPEGFGLAEGAEGADTDGAYQRVVANFLHSLAAHCVASYVLALGERRPGEIMVSPQGYLMFSSLAYADRMPAQSLHKDVTAPPEQRDDRKGSPRSTFAGKLLTADLLAVLGQHANSQASYGLGQPYGSPQEEANALRLQRVGVDLTLLHLSPSTQQLLVTALDAFLAIRRRAEDFVPLLAIHSPLGVPGHASSHDVACLRSRLMLHLDDAAAQFQFVHVLLEYLHLHEL